MTLENIITKIYLYGLQEVHKDINIQKYSKTLKVLRRHKQTKLTLQAPLAKR